MSRVRVLNASGTFSDVECYAIECPFCHSKMTPLYLYKNKNNIFAECSNSGCGRDMVLGLDGMAKYTVVMPNSTPSNRKFSETINSISPRFAEIYNQAYCAEQLSLNQICGVGYRKALEFLIKDYLMSGLENANRKENIKKKFLNNCIQEDVSDERIKSVARRAVWLGNDETHYVRIWADKDVSDLKKLIDLTVRWIENEVETAKLLEDMPEPESKK